MPHGEPSEGWLHKIFGKKKKKEKEKDKPKRGKKKEPSIFERMKEGLAIARTLPKKSKVKKHNPY